MRDAGQAATHKPYLHFAFARARHTSAPHFIVAGNPQLSVTRSQIAYNVVNVALVAMHQRGH